MKEAINYLKAQLAHAEQRHAGVSDELAKIVDDYDAELNKLEEQIESYEEAIRVLEDRETVTIRLSNTAHAVMTCDPELSHGRGNDDL